jgi:hypothetical protein
MAWVANAPLSATVATRLAPSTRRGAREEMGTNDSSGRRRPGGSAHVIGRHAREKLRRVTATADGRRGGSSGGGGNNNKGLAKQSPGVPRDNGEREVWWRDPDSGGLSGAGPRPVRLARHVIGYHVTQETRVPNKCR